MSSSIDIGDLFTLQNSIVSISDSYYAKIDTIIEAVQAFERTICKCVYIVDYYKRAILYGTNNIAHLMGVEAKKIKNLGYNFYIDYIPAEDIGMLREIQKVVLKLFSIFPIEERKNYTISYNIFITKAKRKQLVIHKLTPLVMTKTGEIRLAICTISFASTNSPGNLIVKKVGDSTFYQYSFVDQKWNKHKEVVLTDNEKEVLTLSMQGYTMNEIADIICKSVDTVKGYKRSIFKKMNVKKSTEAIIYAQNHQLI